MKSYSLLGALAILFLAISVVTVFAAFYPPQPILIIPPGAAALVGNEVAGSFTITYPNGRPLILTETTVTLRVCGSTGGCVLVSATLTPTGTGTYTYSFTAPSGVSGAVTITLPAGSFTDSYGTSFPGADTVIGTYST